MAWKTCIGTVLLLLSACEVPPEADNVGLISPVAGRATVTDGDSIRIGVESIRLWGIDAPELDAAGGQQSKDNLVDLIGSKSVSCWRRQKARSFDRLVAACFVGARDLAALQVCAGHAKDAPQFSRGFYDQPECR